MKVSCTQENLNKGLTIVSNLAVKNNNLPILNNILIKTQESGLVLSTTNLEIGISCKIRAMVTKQGMFTVPANILTNFISLLNADEKINIELTNKELILKSEKQETKIKGEDASEFPIIPDVSTTKRNIVNSNDFKKALSQVVFAASLDETRIEINGVYLNFNDKGLTLAATDSYRLAEKKISTKENTNKTQVILPQKTAQELLRILALTEDKDVEIYIDDNQIMFVIEQIRISSRLIEGNYPDYTQIIPTDEKTKIIIDKQTLTKTIKRAALFSKSGINDVDLKTETDKQLFFVKATSSQVGENLNQIEAEIKGDDNNITFNYRYLLDGLNSIESEKVIIKLIDNSSPGLFQAENNDDYLYIIMPIKQ